jgi:hypothetical protein
MALTADEQQLLDQLTKKAAEPDGADDFEVEIFSGDRGARIPYSRAQKWLRDNFDIDGLDGGGQADDGQADGGQDGGQQQTAKRTRAAKPQTAAGQGSTAPAAGFFGKRTT